MRKRTFTNALGPRTVRSPATVFADFIALARVPGRAVGLTIWLEQAIFGDSCPRLAIPSDGSCPICAQIVLQSGAQWGSVAIRSDPRTGVVRFLPPRHSGPKLQAAAAAARATAPTRKRTSGWRFAATTSTAS